VRSPSTALIDLNLKRAAYEKYGVATYWMIDPDESAPSVTILELVEGTDVERATVSGEESITVQAPFPFTLNPADLIRDL
jgi:Uma2 family endonuclease